MAQFYPYLVASLPALSFGHKAPITTDQLYTTAETCIPEHDFALLKNLPAAENVHHTGYRPKTLQRWIDFEIALRNALAAVRATKEHKDASLFVRETRYEHSDVTQVAATAIRMTAPLDAEIYLDEIRWAMLEELALGHFFDVDVLLLYAYKVRILERWDRIKGTRKEGIARFVPDHELMTMTTRKGFITKISGNMVGASFDSFVMQNEVAYIIHGAERLKSEVIRIQGNIAHLQVYESTTNVRVGTEVEFTGELLSVSLGPGLLSQIFDGLQNPLPQLAAQCGFFLKRGIYLNPLSDTAQWHFTPTARVGAAVHAGQYLGFVPEKTIQHCIMVPFTAQGTCELVTIAPAGNYTIHDTIAHIKDQDGKLIPVYLAQTWPVKIPITAYSEKLKPHEPLVTKMRLIDSLFPVARGGTFCVPGPFGAGKTVLQQLTSRHAEVDVVIIAACGERAGEVVETLKTFPHLTDPRTNKPLSDRTVIICNTSSMPVAARESSVYTAVTIAEYYRQMGLNVLLLADSTSRWAQAMREMSGRLEEIPGEEAFPAYLESRIASFYERAGLVRLVDGGIGSITIGGTVSPAGGNFEEPVTQATLKVVGAFHGLSRDRSNARRFPAIDPLISWSKYTSFIPEMHVKAGHAILQKSHTVAQMMKVIGEEGTSLADYIVYLKGEFFDFVYLQQNAFDAVDEATIRERQEYVFSMIHRSIIEQEFAFDEKAQALHFFQRLRQLCKGWDSAAWQSPEFKQMEQEIMQVVGEHSRK